MQRYLIVLLSLLCVVSTVLAAAAATAAPATIPKGYRYDRAGTIGRVEAYLSTLKTIRAHFTQVAPDGSVQEGTFYLKRPGKMRWEYAPPTPVLLVSNGDTISYYDSALGQVNYIDVDDTLAGFLTSREIRMDSTATRITDFSAAADMIRITIEQRANPGQGSLTLEFVDRPLQLKFMTVRDAAGAETRVQLQGAEYDVALPESLFIFKDPRGITGRRK